MAWATVRIGDLGRVVTGKTPPSSQPEMFEGDVPFITPSDMEYDRRDIEPERQVSENWDPKRRSLLPAQSVCVVCIGATIGKLCMTSRASHTNQQVNSIVVDAERFDPGFIYYSLRTSADELKAKAAGAATPIINKSSFSDITIKAPTIETQRRIAAILGAYDDLIEVNRRRVAVLEEMARGLFEEWFVRLRFPGHEQVPLLDTPDGPLPQGWERSQLKNVAVLKSGYAFKSSTFVEEGSYSLVTIKHVHDGVLLPPFQSKIDQLPHNMPSHCHIFTGDMLVSLTGNVGRTCLAWGKNLLLNQRVAKIVANREDLQAFAYVWFRQPHTLKRLQQISNGAAQQNLSPIQTMELPIIIPPFELTEAYQKFAGPILKSCLLSHMTGAILEQQRDLLLPRLISGQLSVEAAERQLEDAA